MSARILPRLILDVAAAGWVVALSFSASFWLGDPMPLWLPIAAFGLTALARRASQAAGIVALVLACGLGTFTLGRPDALAFLVALAAAYRAVSLPQTAPYWALRSEFSLGLTAVLIVAILRLALGSPPAYALALPAAAVVLSGLLGLPYVHSVDALGADQGTKVASSGLRLGGLILGASALLGLLVEGVRLLYLGGHLGFLSTLVYWISYPFVFLFFWAFTPVAQRLQVRGRPAGPPGHAQHLPKPTPLSPHALLMLRIGEVLLLALLGAAVLYLVYRRQRRLAMELGEPNATGAAGLSISRLLPRARRAADYGTGARARVRAAVGHHVERTDLPPHETARRLAAREQWPEAELEAYERARYRLRATFGDEEASHFLQRFTAWRRARRRRR